MSAEMYKAVVRDKPRKPNHLKAVWYAAENPGDWQGKQAVKRSEWPAPKFP